ncbi:MAG: segregation and condensation protein A [Bacillota bacterium]
MELKIKINDFEGPLDLLLHLINTNEMEIRDISIFKITKQYINYLESMKDLDLEITSEFIVMASELLEMKSKILLPNPKYDTDEFNEIQDPKDDLVKRLLEYKKYKTVSKFLNKRYDSYKKVHYRNQQDLSKFVKKIPNEELNKNLEKELLVKGIKRVLKNINRKDNTRDNYFDNVEREKFSVKEKIEFIELKIKNKNYLKFNKLFSEDIYILEVITTFMALLELLKINKISIRQNKTFEQIVIERK